MVLRLFEQQGVRCRIAAELWSFENIKSFVQEHIGLAIVPKVTVRHELREGTLARIPLAELNTPRRTLMIYREQGYVSDSARELIKIVRSFNWDAPAPARPKRPDKASSDARPRTTVKFQGARSRRSNSYGAVQGEL
jgi:DNA-binding transcriptional LysR family regulator